MTTNYQVFVISKNNKPLMPTKRFKKVREMLKSGKAKVVRNKPFTIQLQYETTEYTQELILGIDPGSEVIGFCIRDTSGQIKLAGEVSTRAKEVSENMQERKMYRQSRRNHRRKKRQRRAKKNNTIFKKSNTQGQEQYKKADEKWPKDGFKKDNEVKSNQVNQVNNKSEYKQNAREEERYFKIKGMNELLLCKNIKPGIVRFMHKKRRSGWLTPTANHLLEIHKNIVKLIGRILPLTKIYLEYGKFDLHKLQKPQIKGKEYQQGRQQGYLNAQVFVLCRDGHKCQLCESNKGILQVHHMIKVSQGGTDNPDNLVTLCKKCHEKVHKKPKIAAKLQTIFNKIQKSYVQTTLLNTIMPEYYKWLQQNYQVSITYGYQTKEKRFKYKLAKKHYIDAYLISYTQKQEIKQWDWNKIQLYFFQQFRRHHRQIIHAWRDRNYKLENKIVAKNRNKKMGQLTDSLKEFMQNKPSKELAKLKILPGQKLIRSKFKKINKGDVVQYKDKRCVVKGYGEMGRRVGFVNHKQYVSTKKCQVIAKNTGLVCL